MSQAYTQGYLIKDGRRVMDSSVGALTVQGDINIGANRISFTDVELSRLAANLLQLGVGDSLYLPGDLIEGSSIESIAGDGSTVTFLAKDSGVGLVEVARLQGAADPYFQLTLPPRLLPVATIALPATPLEGMVAYDVTAHKLKVRAVAAWETVVSA